MSPHVIVPRRWTPKAGRQAAVIKQTIHTGCTYASTPWVGRCPMRSSRRRCTHNRRGPAPTTVAWATHGRRPACRCCLCAVTGVLGGRHDRLHEHALMVPALPAHRNDAGANDATVILRCSPSVPPWGHHDRPQHVSRVVARVDQGGFLVRTTRTTSTRA
jgi:hypothetical protein